MPLPGGPHTQTLAQEQALYNQQGQVGSTEQRRGDAGYLWATGLNHEERELAMIFKYRDEHQNYLLHTFMRFFDARMFPVASDSFGWREHGKFRTGLPVTAVTAPGGATIDVTDARANQYYLVNDVMVTGANEYVAGVITAIAPAGGGGFVYTMRKMGGGLWAAGDISVGDVLGFSSNSWGERTRQPQGRTWTPEERHGYLSTLKRSCDVSGDALSHNTEVIELPNGSEAWFYHNQDATIREFMRDRENALLMHKENDGSDGNPLSTKGILNCIMDEAALPVFYTGTPTSETLETILESFNAFNTSNEFFMLAGQTAYNGLQRSIRDRHLDGNVTYTGVGDSVYGESLRIMLGIESYRIFGRVVHLAHYKHLDDTDVFGRVATGASATNIDFSNFFMVLNLGDGGGRFTEINAMGRTNNPVMPLISYMYRENKHSSRGLVFGHQHGMTGSYGAQGGFGPGTHGQVPQMPQDQINIVQTDEDADYFHLLSQIGVRMPAVETSHTFGRANG